MSRIHLAPLMLGTLLCLPASPLFADSVYWSADFEPAYDENGEEIYSYHGGTGDWWNVLTIDPHPTPTSNASWTVYDNNLNPDNAPITFSITGSISSFNGNGHLLGGNPIGADYFYWGDGGGGKDSLPIPDGPVPTEPPPGVIEFHFNGLAPDTQYELTFYGGSESSTRGFDVIVWQASLGYPDAVGFVPNEDHAVVIQPSPFQFPPSVTLTVFSDNGGHIGGQASLLPTAGPLAGEANWAGFQLRLVDEVEAVPEPSSIALALLAAGAIIVLAWRRQQIRNRSVRVPVMTER